MSPTEVLTAVSMLLSLASMPAGEVQPNKVKSIHDVGSMIVACYHPSATYTGVEIVERPWHRAKEWNAENSALLIVSYRGNVFRLNHEITIAAMQRGTEFIALPLKDSNKIPQAKDCTLKNWVGPK